MAVAKEKNYKHFYSFSHGAKVPSTEIQSWIRKGVLAVRSGKPHCSISSGDTSVIVLDYSCGNIEIIVATSDGVSRTTLTGSNDEPGSFYRDLAKKGGPVR